jgi:hypothetical protein
MTMPDAAKPRFRVIANRITQIVQTVAPDAPLNAADKLAQARVRFGQPFGHQPGSTWKPHEVPVLTAWLQSRGKGTE